MLWRVRTQREGGWIAGSGWADLLRKGYRGATGAISRNWPALSDSRAPDVNASGYRR